MTNSISKGVVYEFYKDTKKKGGIKLKGIFEGKVISYNPQTIIQLRDIKEKSTLYNISIDYLKETEKKI